jgi:ribonuclease VapC
MTLDSSALVAVLFAEPGYLEMIDKMLEADHLRIGAPTLVETSLVAGGRRKAAVGDEVDELIKELGVTVVPFGEIEWKLAVKAFQKFGRGRHPAALNFGDCLAYACAARAGDTLLFVGDDFAKTDIVRA